jgi:Bacterial Ig domain
LIPGFGTTLKRLVAGILALSSVVAAPIPSPRPAAAGGYITDSALHAPPASGTYAYYASYGAFGPDQSGFPRQGDGYADPVFGGYIRRLTNEMGQSSDSEIYSKNGYFNADGSLVHHRSPSGHTIVSTATGQVVRAGVPFNAQASFAPDDRDAWYHFAIGDTTLYKYSVSTGARTVVKSFPGALGDNGGSVDWIDRSGRYMVLSVGGATRVYDKATDALYAGSIPGSYGSGGGWISISPDGNYVITSTPPTSSHSWRIDHANKSVSTSPVLFWTLCGGHGDAMTASDGKTYYVSFDCNSTGSIYRADVTLPQSPSNVAQQLSQNKKLVQLSSWGDVDGHFSRVSKGALQDWVFASVESGDDSFSSTVSTWRPYKQEILMMNVLTGEVRRLAHHRSRGLDSSYYAQPRVSASWDGRLVAWTSNFGYSGNGYADLYALTVDGSGATSTGSTTPTLSVAPTPAAPTATAPTLSFTNPASNATVSGTVTVTVQAAGGSNGGYTYVVKAGSATIYTGTGGSFSWNTKNSSNGSVTLTATASDSAGTGSATRTVNVSNQIGTSLNVVNQTSTGSTGTGSSDAVAPTVTMTTPTGSVWTGNSIQVGAQATDNVGLARLEIWGAGKIITTATCSTTTCATSIWWITGTLAPAAYQVNAVAVDKAGNRTVSTPVTVIKDATSPVVASGAASSSTSTTLATTPTLSLTTSPTKTATTTPTALTVTTPTTPTGDATAPTVAITSPASGVWTGNSIQISAAATDNVKVSTIQLYGDASLFGTITCTATTSCSGTVQWLTGSLAPGAHTVTAVATDSSGNRRTSAPVTINR